MLRNTKDRLWIAALSAGVALFYFFTTNRCYPIVDDSLPFVSMVHNGSAINVHHLILVVLGWANRLLGFTDQADLAKTLLLFRGYVAGTSFLTLFLVGILSRRWYGSLQVAVYAVLLTAFAFGYWLYSMITDIPVPATAFGLLAVYFADRSYDASRRRAFLFLLFAALSILVASLNHQSHSIIVIPIASVLLLWNRQKWSWAQRMGRTFFFVVVTAFLGLAVFHSAYMAADTDSDFIAFVRGYQARGKSFPSDRVQLTTPIYTAVGLTRAIVFPEYSLWYYKPYEIVCEHFPFRFMSKYRFLIRGLPKYLISALLVTSGLLLLAWVLAAVKTLHYLRGHPPDNPGFWMVFVWILMQGSFSTWWLATSREFWVWIIPCMSLTGTGLLLMSLRGTARRIIPCVLVVGLFGVNLPVIYSLWNPGNCFFSVNKSYLSELQNNDLAISPYQYSISELALLQNMRAEVFECFPSQFTLDNSALRVALDAVRTDGGRVFLDPRWCTPEVSEIQRLNNTPNTSRATVERELLRVESFCQKSSIPLYGVLREGGGVIRFEQLKFSGYLKWTDAKLNIQDPNG